MTAARRGECRQERGCSLHHAARRLLPEEPPRRRRSPLCRPLRAPCRHPPRRLRHIALVRGRAGGASGVRTHLGRAQLFLARPAAAPADLGGAVARADRHPDRVVAVQAQHPHDDGDVRRPDDHRRRTFLFFIKVNPALVGKLALAVALATPVVILLWRAEPFRVRRVTALLGVLLCLAALAGLSLAVPTDREDEFYPHQYVSKFARSA